MICRVSGLNGPEKTGLYLQHKERFMKPITFIISAFTAGAAATAKDIAGQAVKDTHDSLKAKCP